MAKGFRAGLSLRVGVDTGGTFTDFVVAGAGPLRFLKVPSTPADPAAGVVAGLERLAANLQRTTVVHGSTVATNALLERKGEPAALLTTAGFEDLIEIGRQTRPRLYDLEATRPDPLVPRRLRIGVRERTHADGSRRPPGRAELARVARLCRRLARSGVRSIAVCFLHSYKDGRNESAVGRAIALSGLSVTLSHEVVPEYREFERFSTACANAFLAPTMSRYLEGLEAKVAGRLVVLKSSGLIAPARAVASQPVHAVLSGPAGGVLAVAALAKRTGRDRLIAFDMGGTSTDVALLDREIPFTVESRFAEMPIRVPATAVESVGAGGGSIARLDAGGALRVGPQSAGADPGPACYGRGEDATVTDANLLLGRIGPSELLGGEMRVDLERARRVLARLGRGLSLGAEACAGGVIAVANATMERAIRAVSSQRGHDPRLFTLVCYGGAGGLHACALAESVGIRWIVVPPSPGTFSAYGMVLASAGRDESKTVMAPAGELEPARLESLYEELEKRAAGALTREGARRTLRFERTADLRYRGQSHEVTVAARGDLARAFHGAYRRLYGEAWEGTEVEIVTLRVRATEAKARVEPLSRARSEAVARARRARKPRPAFRSAVIMEGRRRIVPTYRREHLDEGARLRGPARILEYSSTLLFSPGWSALVDRDGNINLSRVGRRF